jgi:hypothetical protein
MAVKTNVVKEVSPNAGLKIVQVWTEAADSADTTVITLANYGIKTVYNVICQVHTTDNSVIVTEASTTAVATGDLTVTIAAGNDGKKRSILIFGA